MGLGGQPVHANGSDVGRRTVDSSSPLFGLGAHTPRAALQLPGSAQSPLASMKPAISITDTHSDRSATSPEVAASPLLAIADAKSGQDAAEDMDDLNKKMKEAASQNLDPARKLEEQMSEAVDASATAKAKAKSKAAAKSGAGKATAKAKAKPKALAKKPAKRCAGVLAHV